MKNTFAIAILFIFISLQFKAQGDFKPHISNFNMTSINYKHNQKWSFYVELQMRSIEDYMLPNYYEVKGGPAFNLNKNNQILVGFGRYGTYRESRFYQREYRTWLQYVFSHSIDRIKFDHRGRAEKRFFYYPQTGREVNDERYRYRLSITVPLNSEKIKEGTLYFNTFEELFFGPKNPDTFKRNRFYAGFGYQVNDFMNANFGYMNQVEKSSENGDRPYHFVYMGINFTIDRLKLNEHSPIPVID